MLDNLLGNAIKYSPDGGEIVVGVTLTEGEARLSVADQGVGIPGETLPRPGERTTALGPMLDEKAATRSEGWIQEAVSAGARVLTGGAAEGRFMQPTIIENAAKESYVCSREAFAPLVTLFPVKSFREAVDHVNDSVYGLQAGVFTNDLEKALYAFDHIEAGAVILNDIPTYRIDHMPYGGVKDSGLSREGLRYAIEDMTEMRLLVVNRLESQRLS